MPRQRLHHHTPQVARPVTSEEVNSLLKEASQSYLKDILGFDEVPKVSTDYVNDSRSSIVDAACTQVGRWGWGSCMC
jgi:glyceraldehyde 3-phosphate dehydrogenase